MEDILDVFIQEAREQLTEMENGLMRMEQGDRDPETINAVFRAAHTIKGGSGGCAGHGRIHHVVGAPWTLLAAKMSATR